MVKRIAVDIGNSTIACALFDEKNLLTKWYHSVTETSDAAHSLSEKCRSENVKTVAVSTVVPSAREALVKQLSEANVGTLQVSLQTQKSISNTYPTLGNDRLANTIAALKLYVKDTADAGIVIDFGTATTLTAVSNSGRLLGGMITLGLRETMKAIYSNIDQLPLLDIDKPFRKQDIEPLATTTEAAILNGTLLGHIALVEEWIAQSRKRIDGKAVVIATGGLAPFFADAFTGSINYFDRDLTLKGINLIAVEAADQEDLV